MKLQLSRPLHFVLPPLPLPLPPPSRAFFRWILLRVRPLSSSLVSGRASSSSLPLSSEEEKSSSFGGFTWISSCRCREFGRFFFRSSHTREKSAGTEILRKLGAKGYEGLTVIGTPSGLGLTDGRFVHAAPLAMHLGFFRRESNKHVVDLYFVLL